MSQHHSRVHAQRQHNGFTLVELLVALLIGLFLLGGLMTVVQDNRRTFASQNQLSQLQDSERLAMTMMTDVIQTAGYFPAPTVNTAVSALPILGALAAGQAMVGTFNAAAPGDTITVQYATTNNDGILNCVGGTNQTGNVAPLQYTNVFSVVNGQLVCTLTIGGAGGVTTVNPLVGAVTGTPNAIIVNNLSVLYGVSAGGGSTNVDTYVNATNVPNWNSIISVQITLTFNNPLWSATSPPTIQRYLTFQRVVSVMNQTGI